ncbi:sugar ABC transporter ATP-binding protein [Paludibaculum fermentans]|uniref:sugar ABC transporter ATP-binding protein n=1 Tax=Paludibaculum fermentans TaxID=1473598 RepID=UPI003EB753EB
MQKRFGGVVALRDGHLEVRRGEVHLLLGENGAGKSTLMKILAGMQRPDAGTLEWQGRLVDFASPAESQRAGVAMVHQECLLAPHLTVAENIYLGRERPAAFGLIHRRKALEDARRLIEEHHFPLQAEWLVQRLSPAGRQLVEILRAIAHGSSLLIFDEPTSSLPNSESKEVFRIVRGLRARGTSIIYITHRMDELRELGDRVTVLRDGATVFTGEMQETTTAELIRHMVGRPLEAVYQRQPVAAGREMLRVEGLSRRGVLYDVSLQVRAGEVVGLAGLIGAGRTELCRAIFGVDPLDAGTVSVQGQVVRIRSPRDAVRAGMALIPEDRQKYGLAVGLPVAQNMLMASLERVSTFGFLNRARAQALVDGQSARLNLKSAASSQPAGKLSGGNQQKVVIARWMTRGANIILFDEPTRGIDIGAKIEVFRLIDELARGGAAVLMVSSELPELLQVADRILVMRQGRIAAELPGQTTQEEILRHAALGGGEPERVA